MFRTTKLFTVLLKIQLITVCVLALCSPSSAQGKSPIQDPVANVRPACTPPEYLAPPQPDIIAEELRYRKRYRLVIGAGEYKDQSVDNNRPFVDPSAVDVDSALNDLHYDALPVVSKGGTPYLTGTRANRAEVTAALNEMAILTKGEDFGIIYYVGHGNVTYDGNDLTLGLYDEVVGNETGLHAKEIFGIMTNKKYHTSIKEIPHLFIVIDSCFSGTLAQPTAITIQTVDGKQRLVQIVGGGPIIPDQVSVLTSTAPGSNSSAYELHGTGRSAFSYYFSRALKEDWVCADSLSRDGILILSEMQQYLSTSLELASQKHLLDRPMEPQMLARDVNSLLAYRPDKYSEPGFRNLIYSLLVKPSPNETVQITLPGDVQTTCDDPTNGCTFPVSKAYADSKVAITRSRLVPGKGGTGVEKEKTTVKLSDLVSGSKTVLGTTLKASELSYQ